MNEASSVRSTNDLKPWSPGFWREVWRVSEGSVPLIGLAFLNATAQIVEERAAEIVAWTERVAERYRPAGNSDEASS